jgi:hypothetical protein
MYTIPQLYQAEDHLCPVDDNKIRICADESVRKTLTCSDDTIFELCTILMKDNNLSKAQDVNEAKTLYIRLRQLIRFELERL